MGNHLTTKANTPNPTLSAFVMTSTILLQGGGALAQNTQGALEEVIVTASKREQSLQDVSLSITAVSGAELVAQGITDISRIEHLAPGLQFSQSGNDVRPVIRGARTEQVESADVAVAFYTDGIYRPRHGQAMAGFTDVERVEVLRGPQGTLFGRNAFGGAINVISKKPDFGSLSYGGAATIGEYSQRRGEGFINLPVNEKLALRLSGVRETRDPFVENVVPGVGGLKDADNLYLRGQLAFIPREDLEINFRAEYWEDKANGTGDFGYKIEGIPVNSATGLTNGVTGIMEPRVGRSSDCANPSNCGRAGAGIDDTAVSTLASPYRVAIDTEPSRNIEETDFAVELNWALSSVDLKVIAAHLDYEEQRFSDGDVSPNPFVVSGNDITSKTSSLEIQLTSAQPGPLEWVAGLFYFQEDLSNAFLWKDRNAIDPETNTPDTSAPIDLWAPWMSQIQLDTESFAAYGQATYSFSPEFRVIGGLRYTQDDRKWDIFSQDDDNRETISFNELTLAGAEGSWDAVTWKAGIEYDLGADAMFYATASTGFLAGNAQGAFNGDNSYDEQTVLAYEIGIKSKLLDNRVTLNAAIYRNEYEDLLSTRFVDAGATTLAFFGNAGEATATGLELELDWAATDALRLGLRAAFTNTEFGNFVTPNVFEEGGQEILGVSNQFQLDGLDIPMSPEVTLTALASYAIDLKNLGMLRPAITAYYSDSYRASDAPFFFGEQDSYTRTDLSVTWSSVDAAWSARLFVNNIEDEAVLLRATRFGGNVAVTDYGPPRIWGLRVARNF